MWRVGAPDHVTTWGPKRQGRLGGPGTGHPKFFASEGSESCGIHGGCPPGRVPGGKGRGLWVMTCLLFPRSEKEANLAQTWPGADSRSEARAEWQPALHQGVAESDLSQVSRWQPFPLQPACSLRGLDTYPTTRAPGPWVSLRGSSTVPETPGAPGMGADLSLLSTFEDSLWGPSSQPGRERTYLPHLVWAFPWNLPEREATVPILWTRSGGWRPA